MRRRDFIKGIAGSTIAWLLAASAQLREQKRRVAVLMGGLTRGEADRRRVASTSRRAKRRVPAQRCEPSIPLPALAREAKAKST